MLRAVATLLAAAGAVLARPYPSLPRCAAPLPRGLRSSGRVALEPSSLTGVVHAHLYPGGASFVEIRGGSNASLTTRNALQAAIMGGSRLHIPVTFHEETLHGGCEGCVIFPMPAGQGSTWDTDIVHDIARVIATEAYAAGMDRGFSPEVRFLALKRR